MPPQRQCRRRPPTTMTGSTKRRPYSHAFSHFLLSRFRDSAFDSRVARKMRALGFISPGAAREPKRHLRVLPHTLSTSPRISMADICAKLRRPDFGHDAIAPLFRSIDGRMPRDDAIEAFTKADARRRYIIFRCKSRRDMHRIKDDARVSCREDDDAPLACRFLPAPPLLLAQLLCLKKIAAISNISDI